MSGDKMTDKTKRTSGKTIAVIGGGASGMAAAISAAMHGAGTVLMLEKNDVLGRKLLATGNGRCNLTNTNCRDAEETLDFFKGLGLMTRVETEGRVYPYSEQAAAVQEALVSELEYLSVEILGGREVKSVEKVDSGFLITAAGGESFFANAVILATGGKAGPQYGSTGDGYRFAKSFSHNVVSVKPSLVQMVSDQKYFKELKGVRAKVQVELLRGSRAMDRETGEIQFTEDGLSGICIFNLSKAFARGDAVKIDLFPEYSGEALENILTGRAATLGSRRLTEFFTGMLHKKLAPVILSELSLQAGEKAASLSREAIARIAAFLKGWSIPVTGTKGWKEAQVTAGGVDLAEIDTDTMESRLTPNLYFAGELLDVDEKCGGYNLQWAWTSGLLAGRSAAIAVRGKSDAAGLERNHAENT